jgi:hypothetical protein
MQASGHLPLFAMAPGHQLLPTPPLPCDFSLAAAHCRWRYLFPAAVVIQTPLKPPLFLAVIRSAGRIQIQQPPAPAVLPPCRARCWFSLLAVEPHRRSSSSDFPSQPKFLHLLESLSAHLHGRPHGSLMRTPPPFPSRLSALPWRLAPLRSRSAPRAPLDNRRCLPRRGLQTSTLSQPAASSNLHPRWLSISLSSSALILPMRRLHGCGHRTVLALCMWPRSISVCARPWPRLDLAQPQLRSALLCSPWPARVLGLLSLLFSGRARPCLSLDCAARLW